MSNWETTDTFIASWMLIIEMLASSRQCQWLKWLYQPHCVCSAGTEIPIWGVNLHFVTDIIHVDVFNRGKTVTLANCYVTKNRATVCACSRVCVCVCACVFSSRGPFYKHGLALIPPWIINYIHYKVWDEITYPFLNFIGATVEV